MDSFLEYLPDDELKMTLLLRNVVKSCIPDAIEKLSYNVPFYKKYKNICFIWPSSILWGRIKTFSGVRFGFPSGFLLNDEINYLEKGNRKQVYWKNYFDIKDIDIDILRSFIFEAAILDEQLGRKMNQ